VAGYTSLSDLQLTDLLKKGDEAAFAEIYRRHAENLAGFAASKLFSLEDARDIIHDLFVNLWQNRAQLEITGNLNAFLFASVRYRIIDKIRKNVTREEYAGMIKTLSNSLEPAVEQQIAAKELQQTIQKAISQLSPRVKTIYQLSREEHLSIPEIAKQLDLSEQTVKNQLTTALKHLRQSLSICTTAALIYWLS
jgi:RNA polymerase sigma-70 factor (family 1)